MKRSLLLTSLLLGLHGVTMATAQGGGIPVHDVASMPTLLYANLTSKGAVFDDHKVRGATPTPCQPAKGEPVTVLDSTSETGDARATMALIRVEQGRCVGQVGWVRTTHIESLKAAREAQ